MKIDRIFAFLSLILLLFCGCSIPADDEEEAETEVTDKATAELSWEGETDKFIISETEGVRLNDPQEEAGTAYISIPSSSVRNTRWEFGVQLSFNPSANNYARFYLVSSSTTLSENGYFVQIGGAKDNVGLYRQNEGQPKLLASGRELMKNNNAPKLYVKVECDNNGYWTFWTRLNTEADYTLEKQVQDGTILNSICSGIYCVYTKTRSNGFTFHHIRISQDVETSTDPETPESPDTPEKVQPGYPAEVRGVLLFNEVMYDQDADGAEYIELYNPSDTVVSFPALRLLRYESYGSDSVRTTQDVILRHPDGDRNLTFPPYGYICLTKSAAALIEKHKASEGTIIEISKFPEINNNGGHLAIMTDEETSRLIDKCSYAESMHSSGDVRNRGIALEKKSPGLASSQSKNWRSSKDATGGTPGRENSRTEN